MKETVSTKGRIMAKKKRYHQSVKDRMSESRGMERYETVKNMRRTEEYAWWIVTGKLSPS